MSIIGNPLITTNYISDSFSGDASTVAFTLSQAPASDASIAVYISGLYQIPTSAYSISGTTLTFTGAPPTGTNNITVLHLGVKSATLVPVNGSVTPQMLSNANVVYWSASNNNVGIGNVTPTSLLTVTGTAALGNTTVGTMAAGNTTITGTLTASANVNLDSGTFFVDGTNNRVGINNAAPTSALTVTGNAAFSNTVTIGGEYISPHTGFKNRIINGAMVINQRAFSATITTNQYTLDRWQATSPTDSGKFSVSQSSTAATGFSYSLLATSLTAYTVLTNDRFSINQAIEGYNIADLAWGTASASTITLSFWVRSSLTGTFGGSLTNNNGDRSYPFTFTISSANTFEYKTITITGPTTGTWGSTNGTGVLLFFGLGVGATYSGTAGTWANADYRSATGATSVVGTNGATFYITGVQLEKGSTATSFDYRPYGTELALCQRYYCFWGGVNTSFAALAMWNLNANVACARMFYPVTMRAAPTMTYTGTINTDIRLYYAGAYINMSSFTPASDTSKDSFRIDANVSSGIVSGGASGLYIPTTAGSIIASAEL